MEAYLLPLGCMIGGLALVIVEAILPGFGLPGIGGLVLEIVGVSLIGIHSGVNAGLLAALIMLALDGIAVALTLRSVAKGRLSKSKLVLQESEQGFAASEDNSALLGKTGKALTVLRPTGMAEIDGRRVDVLTSGEYIEAGTTVKVVRTEGSKIVVIAADKAIA